MTINSTDDTSLTKHPLICRYVYTRGEYLRVISFYRWKRFPIIFFIQLIAVFVIAHQAYSDLSVQAAAHHIGIMDFGIINLLRYSLHYAPPLSIQLILNAFLLSPAWSYYQYFVWFKRSPFYGKEMLLWHSRTGPHLTNKRF